MTPARSITTLHREALRVSLPCAVEGIGQARSQARQFLEERGLGTADLAAWELAIGEGLNNAVLHVEADHRELPVTLEVSCGGTEAEARITDHARAFTWPDTLQLPPPEQEHGRGLFLIEAMVHQLDYQTGRHGNTLLLRRRHDAPLPPETTARAESESTLALMTEELASCYETLAAIFRFSAELGIPESSADFAQRLLNHLLTITDADWFLCRMYDPETDALHLCSLSAETGDVAPFLVANQATDPLCAEGRAAATLQDVWLSPSHPPSPEDPLQAMGPFRHALVHPVFHAERLVGVLTLGRQDADAPFTAAHANVIHLFAEFLAVHFNTAAQQKERIEAGRLSRDLEIARTIQQSLLPAQLPDMHRLETAGHSESAREVGGDFFDVIELGPDRYLLTIADVMGKGIASALLASLLRSSIRARADLAPDPGHLMEDVNRILHEDLSRVEVFITAQCLLVDLRQGVLQLANAGHCPMLALPRASSQAEEVAPDGFPLGIEAATRYPTATLALNRYSHLLLYTDGVTETRRADGEWFGTPRLRDWFAGAARQGHSAGTLRDQLQQMLDGFGPSGEAQDDRTFLLLRHEP